MSVLAEPIPSLVTIPNVELVAVGEWETATTGHATFTEAHLKAAVAALDDPSVKAPRLRVGHTGPDTSATESAGGFADQPAFGRFVNLRLADNGTKIVADMAGVPSWLAEVMPSAYPSRSVEAYFDVTTAAGRKHDMVITSVALLGVSLPAVQTLDDLLIAYSDETPGGAQLQFIAGDRVAATRGGVMPERVSASVTYTDVRRSFYEDFATDESGRYWWWICDFIMAPPTAIADDDEGGLWSVPYTIKGDTISWGDPVEVRIQYVEKESGKVAAAILEVAGTRAFASAAESRPKDRVRAAKPTKEESMTAIAPAAVLERLGLPEDATEEQILAKLDEEQGDPEPAPEPEPKPEGDTEPQPEAPQPAAGAVVDPDALAQLQRDAALGREAREQQVSAERAELVTERIRKGCIPASSKQAHLAELAKGGEIEKAHRAYLAQLTEGVIPVDEQGVAPSEGTDEQAVHADLMSAAYGIDVTAGKERS